MLLAIFAMQSFWFIKTQSMTYDEPAHIIAGVDAWRHGRFEHWNDHPPLGRLWLTLPIRDLDSNFVWRQMPTGYRIDSMKPGPEDMAARTRPMNTLLGIFMGLAIWFAARRLFSEGAANVALTLFVFTPSLIANLLGCHHRWHRYALHLSGGFPTDTLAKQAEAGFRLCSWDLPRRTAAGQVLRASAGAAGASADAGAEA